MVTGRVPFEGDTPFSDRASSTRARSRRIPSELNVQIPDDLSRVILRCLEKDKEKRYQSAEELRSELTRIEEEIPTAERAVPRRKPTKIKRGRAPERARSSGPRSLSTGPQLFVLALIVYAGIHLFTGRGEVIDSIAVLPFENVNADPDTDYLCDGITETIINKLSQLSGFKKVIDRNSVFTYKGKTVDPKTVGRELGVSAVLVTRMVRIGDRLTISPTLVRAKDNSQIWGERYDRKFEDIFSIEENIAAIDRSGAAIEADSGRSAEESQRGPSTIPRLMNCISGPITRSGRFREDALDRIVQDLQNALDITGPNPLLYSAMANAYRQYVNIGARQEDYLEKAEDYAKKALALDPGFSKANVVLAVT